MWGSGEVLHLGGGGEHVPRARPTGELWQSEFLVPPKKARRLERSWAEVFRNEALPQID